MAFITVAAGQPIRATHVTQFSQWLTGIKVDSPGTITATSASEYALTVFSNNTGAGNALKIQYGASASSATTIATFNATGLGVGNYIFGQSSISISSGTLSIGAATFDSTTVTLATGATFTATAATISNFRDKGGIVHDIRAYGAVRDAAISSSAWTGTDNATAIALAVAAASSGSSSHEVYIPGVYGIATSLNLTAITGGITLRGDGHQNSRIVALAGTGIAGKPLLDMVGSGHMHLIDLGIGDTANATIPSTAILMGESSAGPNQSAEHRFERLKVDGLYSLAAWYNFGGASSRLHDCIFSNSYHSAATPTVYLSTNNSGSATSAFVQVYTSAAAVSDIDFVACEIHSNYVSGVSIVSYPLRLDGNAGDIKLHGGIIDGGADRLVSYTESGGASPVDITFSHVTQRQADGATEPTYVHYFATAGMTVSNLRVVGGSQTAHTSGAIFGGASAVTLIDLHYDGRPTNSASKISYFGGNNANMTHPVIDCHGLDFNVGTSGQMVAYRIFEVGTLTASTTRAGMSTDAAGIPNFYTGVTFGAGPANVGAAIRLSNGDGIYALNAAGTGSILLASKDGSDNVNVGQGTGMAKTLVNATTGVDLVVGTTARVAATTTGVNLTGAFVSSGAANFLSTLDVTSTANFRSTVTMASTLAVTTAISVGGASAATVGGVRLSSNTGIYSRNSTNATNVALAVLDGSDNGQIGDVAAVSVMNIAAANGMRFTAPSGYFEWAPTAVSVTAATGLFTLPSCAGNPTGTPSPTAGQIPLLYNSSSNRMFAYNGGTWVSAAFA